MANIIRHSFATINQLQPAWFAGAFWELHHHDKHTLLSWANYRKTAAELASMEFFAVYTAGGEL